MRAQPSDPFLFDMIHQGVTCPPTSTWFALKSHRTRGEVCSDTICSAPNCRPLSDSHTTTLHTVTLYSTLRVRTKHIEKFRVDLWGQSLILKSN